MTEYIKQFSTELNTGEEEVSETPLYEVWYSSTTGQWMLDKDDENISMHEDKEDAIYEMMKLKDNN